MRKGSTQSCNSCAYYIFDEEYGEYICDVAMDEDDYMRLQLEPHSVSYTHLTLPTIA